MQQRKAKQSKEKQNKQNEKKAKQSKNKQSRPEGDSDENAAAHSSIEEEYEMIYQKIDDAFCRLTDRRLTEEERRIVASFLDEGMTCQYIVQAINEVDERQHGSIHSFRYFIPILTDPDRKNADRQADKDSIFSDDGYSHKWESEERRAFYYQIDNII